VGVYSFGSVLLFFPSPPRNAKSRSEWYSFLPPLRTLTPNLLFFGRVVSEIGSASSGSRPLSFFGEALSRIV